MSIARKRRFVKFGLRDKTRIRKYRKYIRSYPKCNRGYAFGNLAHNLGVAFNLVFIQKDIKT